MNQYTLDGVPLRDPALRWFADRNTGIRILPARRQPEQRFPWVDGVIFHRGAPYDAGEIAIQLQVKGESYLKFRENLEFITALMSQRNKLLELRDHYDPEVPTWDRIAMVTLSSSVEPRMIDRQSALVGAVFSIPDTFWRSAEYITGVSPAVSTSSPNVNTQSLLLGLTKGNAPIDDMVLRIRGAFSTARIEDPVTGRMLHVNTPLKANETMLIDTKAWKAVIVAGATGDSWSLDTGRVVTGFINPNVGHGSMFLIEPRLGPTREAFVYSMGVGATNITSPVTVAYRARTSYL